MSGLKIVIDAGEAERELKKVQKGFSDLGIEAIRNEKDLKRVEDRLDGLQKSLNLTRLETAKLQAKVGDYSGALKTMTGGIENTAKKVALLSSIMATAALGGIAIFGKGLLETAKSFEKYETQLKTITGSSAKAKEAMAWITEFTAKTPYELDQVTGAFIKLQSYGINANAWMKTLGNTAAAMGKDLDQAVEMFADAAVGEFERLKEFGVRASTQGDIVTFKWSQNGQDMVKSTQKTQAGITSALGEVFSRFDGSMDDLSNTWEGMISNLSDKWTMFKKDIADAGPFQVMKDGLKDFLDYLDTNDGRMNLKAWANDTAEAVLSSFQLMIRGGAYFSETIDGIRLAFGAVIKYQSTRAVSDIEKAIESLESLYKRQSSDGAIEVNIANQQKYAASIQVLNEKLADAKINLSAATMMVNDNSQSIMDTEKNYNNLISKISELRNKKPKEVFEQISSSAIGTGSAINKATAHIDAYAKKYQKIIDSTFEASITAKQKELDQYKRTEGAKPAIVKAAQDEINKIIDNATDAALDAIEKEEKARDKAAKKILDDRKKEEDAAKNTSANIASAMESMYKDIGLHGDENYTYQLGLLEAQKKAYKDMGVKNGLEETWFTAKHKELKKQQTLDSNDFFAGVKLGFQENQDDMLAWAQAGKNISEKMASGMHSAFSDTLFDALKGDIDDISQIWESFMDSMLHELTDTVSKMAIQWGIGAIGSAGTTMGWWDGGAWEVKQDHVAVIHKGEMVVPADIASVVRGGSGSPDVSTLAQVSPDGGHEWSDAFQSVFARSMKDQYSLNAVQGASLWARGDISGGDFLTSMLSPEMLISAGAGAVTTTATDAMGMRTDNFGNIGQFIGSMIGGSLAGPLGVVLGGLIGATGGMGLGDLLNMRTNEDIRDYLEKQYGFFAAQRIYNTGFSGSFDYAGDYAYDSGYDYAGDYGGNSGGSGSNNYSGGSQSDYGGIGGYATGGVIDSLIVPAGEDGYAAVQYGEGVVTKNGMSVLEAINSGNASGAISAIQQQQYISPDVYDTGSGFNAGAFNATYARNADKIRAELVNYVMTDVLNISDLSETLKSLGAQIWKPDWSELSAGYIGVTLENVGVYFDQISDKANALTISGEDSISVIDNLVGRLESMQLVFSMANGQNETSEAIANAAWQFMDVIKETATESAVESLNALPGDIADLFKPLRDRPTMVLADYEIGNNDVALLTQMIENKYKAWDDEWKNAMEDAALLISGVSEGSAESLETALIRISDALITNDISTVQFEALTDAAMAAFEGVADSTTAMIEEIGDATQELEDITKSMAYLSKERSLTIQLLGLQGNAEGALALQRQTEIEQLKSSFGDASGSLESLLNQIWALEDAAKVAATAESNLARATEDYTEGLSSEIKKLSAELQTLEDTVETTRGAYVDGLMKEADALKEAQSAAQSNYDDAETAYVSAIENMINENESLINTYENLSQSIKQYKQSLLISDTSFTPDQRYAETTSQLMNIAKDINSADEYSRLKALKALPDAGSDFLTASRNANTDGQKYQSDLSQLLSILDKADAIAVEQKTTEEKSLDALQNTLAGIKGIEASEKSIVQLEQEYLWAQQDLAAANNNLLNEKFTEQANALLGIDDTGKSLLELEAAYFEADRILKESDLASQIIRHQEILNALSAISSSQSSLSSLQAAYASGTVVSSTLPDTPLLDMTLPDTTLPDATTDWHTAVADQYKNAIAANNDLSWVQPILEDQRAKTGTLSDEWLSKQLTAGPDNIIPGFASGGTIYGSADGYTIPTTFHGVEHITPDSQMVGVKNELAQIRQLLFAMLNMDGDRKELLQDLKDIYRKNMQGGTTFKVEAA